jgi:hypothetical protein
MLTTSGAARHRSGRRDSDGRGGEVRLGSTETSQTAAGCARESASTCRRPGRRSRAAPSASDHAGVEFT